MNIEYSDPYAKRKPDEFQAYATTIIDGVGFRLDTDGKLLNMGPVTVDENEKAHQVERGGVVVVL